MYIRIHIYIYICIERERDRERERERAFARSFVDSVLPVPAGPSGAPP